ncbi:ice-binding family protein [Patiriisocius sp. Uisw_017]|uniref:DUF7507 domain-containing protein n=1 Tax=Patiriisocius sp. Uisw_017 TaxID=3230968 RepID=UPI0039EBCBCC
MNKKLLFSLTTISLLLLSSIGFSQTLELGTLSSFGAFSGTGGIANSGQIEGDTGTYDGIFSGNGSNSGQQYPSGSPTSKQAQIDVLRVYVHLSDVFVTNAGTHSSVFGNGETIFPGVYSTPGAGSVTGTLTLDGLGNSDAVFIIKFEGALTVGASATIVLSNGTKAANVYWISEGAITLGANSVVRGSVFAHPGGITVGANGTIEGRLITSEGAVTVGAGGSLVIPVGPSDIQINCLGTCNSNPNVDILGSVKSFAMFTSSGAVSNAATSGFIGDIGTNAGAITGIQTGATTHVGKIYPPGPIAAQAAQDLSSAYNQLMAIQSTDLGHIPLFGNGETMQPGVYYIAGAGSLQGTIVLDGNFDPDAIFIFKFLGAFTVTAQSKIILKNGARRCNIFWVSGAGGTGAIDIGTFAFVKGTFLAHGGACTAAANVNLEGRLLSTAGAIGFSTGVIYNDTLCFEDEIAIVKTGLFVDANGDQCADVGETIDYTFTVTNEGNESLSAIVVTDPLVPIIAYVSGDTNGNMELDMTETWIYTGTFTIDQGDIDAGGVTNQALAKATTYNGFLINDLSDDSSVLEDDPTITELCNLRLVLVEKIDILCNGFNTGSITVSATGGSPPYMFTLNGGIPQSSPLFDNLLAGVYTIGITDTTAGNPNAIVVTLVEPNALSIVITKVNATTGQGCLDGQATVTASGGTPPYTYQWNASAGSQTSMTATNLPAGTHIVAVTDDNGCILEQGVVIDCVNTCDAVIAIDSIVNVFCAGATTGSATVIASSIANPTATFTFTWNSVPLQVDSGVTTSTINNLAAGVYTVSVTIDGTVCLPVEQSVIITEPTNALNVTATSTDESGPATGDGTATANPTGGTPSYTYSWNTTPVQTTQTITGLSAGTYIVTVTDDNGCVATASTVVNPGTCNNLAVIASSTPVTCNGFSDGSIIANVTGGVGPFTYSWNTTPVQTTQTINGLTAGVYTVTVTDGTTLCTVTSTATVNQPGILSSGIAITNVICFGNDSGSLDLTVTGGTPPYSFAWGPGGEITEDIFSLTAGTYSVLITDANGCTTTNSAEVLEPSEELAITYTVVDVLCNGYLSGAIDITVTGGTPPYSYVWNNGTFTEDQINVVAGTYSVTVTDANGCTIPENGIIVNEPANALSIVITKVNATTGQGCLDGQATVTPSGGTPPYTYQWNASAGSQTSMIATNLPEGTHIVTVTDDNGCILEQGVVIDCVNTCDAVIAIDSIVNVFCAGATTGSATVIASSIANPTATFTFTWNSVPPQVDSGVTTSTINNLAAGVYTVSVTIDGTVCLPVEQSVIITEPTNSLNVTATSTDESGPATGDGTATANPTGGTPSYTYSWNTTPVQTTQTITGLSAGTYIVTVTDDNGCVATASTIVNPRTCNNLAVIASSTPVTCNGFSDGSVIANVTGGVGPFTYSWNTTPVQTTQTINGLTAGVYTVTVTDGTTLCTVTSTATVNQPVILSSGIAITNVICFGNDSGSLDLTVTGGTPPYSFAWSPGGEITEDLFSLTAGTYSVLITDANGCTTTNSAEVLESSEELAITYTVVDVLCNGYLSGAIDITVTGGTPPYSYVWNNGTFTEDQINVVAGTYSVTVTDANGCTIPENGIIVNEPANALSIVITKVNATTASECTDGQATATASGGTPPYTYQWSASAGSQTSMIATNLPEGTHIVTVTDDNGCILEQGVVIDCVNTCDAVIAIDSIVNVFCAGATTGSATVIASSIANPTATFTFTWNSVPPQVDSGVTTSTINNLAAGVYTVSVTIDGTVCLPVEQSVIITEPTNSLNVTATSTDESGPATGDGTATANPTGGTPSYTYSWNTTPVQTTQTITGLSAGTYIVTVTDDNGCVATASTIVNPRTCNNLAVIASSTPVTCNGFSDGSVIANVTGGVGPFTYSWNTTPVQTTQTINGLTAGVYTVTVTDGTTLCTVTSTATVNQPVILSSGIAITNVICFGNDSGSLDLTVTGGTPPYSFAWSPGGEITEDLFSLTSGTYSVLITDANGCTTTNSAEVLEPSEGLTLTISSQTDILCETFGSVTVIAAGGNPPYSYNLDGGIFQSSGTFNNLTEGVYNISVLGANNCDASIEITILENCTLAIEDINNTFINLPVSGNVLTNDIDAEGDTQTVTTTTVTTVQGVLITINPTTGEYNYTPPTDYEGEDSFEYSIVDNGSPQASDSATVYIEIMSYLNNRPVANADTNTTEMDVAVSGNVLVNDFHPDGNTIVVTTNTTPLNGSVVVNPDGSYIYTPDLGFIGQDIFTYTICDNGTPVLCDTAVVIIQIIPDDRNITVANDDAYYGFADMNISGNLMDNDFDPEGDNQLVDTPSPVSGPSNGILVLNVDGSFTYTPNAGYTGTDQFVYSIFDNGTPVATDLAVVYLTVNIASSIAIIKTGVFNEVNGNDCADAEIDTVTYTFTVTNEGGSAITSVTVTDPLLGGLLTAIPTGDTDGDNELDVTETWVYVQGYTITQSDIDTGSISNQATADGTGSTGPVSDLSDDNLTTEDDVTVTVLCQNDSIALIKTGVFNDSNGDSCADVDETITYSFTVINNGNTTIGNIAITDALVNVQGGPITLAPGATDNTTFTATYLITQANIDNGNVTNTATASGFNPLGVVVSDISDDSSELEDDVTITVLCQNDSIALIKTGVFNDSNGDSCADVDETITYSFTVINNGNTTIGNIAITDALVNVQGGPITLAPGQTDTTTFTATYLIIQPDINTGSVTNTATASGFNPLGVVVSDISDVASELEDAPTVTLLCNNAVIALIKTGIPTDENGDGCIDLGETIVYDFVVTNLGNVTLTNVIVTDPMITVNGGSITLFAGDSDTETFSGSYTIVQSDIDAGQVSNQAIAEGLDPLGVVVNDLSDNNSNLEDDATISLLCQDPIIALEKTGIFNDENSNLISEVGETISYTFVVTNRGNVTLFNIAIVDPFPRVVIEGGPIFQLLPGEIDDTTFTATYTITAQDIENGEVLNQAIVSATTFDGDEVTDLSDDPTDFTDADSDGDGDPDDITVVILPNVDAPFDVFNAVSPDGNNQNDFFLIQGISEFPDNTVEIYNRWGVLVWEASGYGGSNDAENVFVGESNGRATVSQDKLLVTGTYYYVIKFNGNNPGQDSYAGYLYLNR